MRRMYQRGAGCTHKGYRVTEVVSVSMDENKAVVKVEKGKVTTDDLVKAVEADPRFKATVAN